MLEKIYQNAKEKVEMNVLPTLVESQLGALLQNRGRVERSRREISVMYNVYSVLERPSFFRLMVQSSVCTPDI